METYIAILIARLFRVRIVIIARFDLEIKQYDVINMFVNAKHNLNSLTMVCKLLDRFKVLGKCVKINQALYSLKDSLVL